jgi:ATP-dependent Clp protease ATP-binding subunit ClpC
MEDGRLTDSQGRKVDFKNAVIVMTSNLGARSITDKQKSLGFTAAGESEGETRSLEDIREKVMKELKDTFKPEFLNRIDDVIVFHQLDREHIRAIARHMLEELEKRMAELEIGFLADNEAIDLLAEKGFDPAFGARPLRRVIQSAIEDAAAEKILEGQVSPGDLLLVTAKDGQIVLEKAPKSTPALQPVAMAAGLLEEPAEE